MPARFVIFKGTNILFYFGLKAANGERLLASESYLTKASCGQGIHTVRLNAAIDARYERKVSDRQFYFVLTAGNGEVIGTSEMYTTPGARENGIEAVKREAATANVDDLTR